MFKNMKSWYSGLSRLGKGGVILASFLVASTAAAPLTKTNPPNPQPPVDVTTTQSEPKAPPPDPTEKKTLTETQAVAFEKTTVNDNTLLQGEKKIRTTGTNGVKTLTYEVIYKNGVQASKNLVKEEVTTSPVTEITAIGTKVILNCPNGSYVNSAGSEVCSPYSAPSVPAGASAICGDGSYSFSQSRSGTCSHHGGVSTWL